MTANEIVNSINMLRKTYGLRRNGTSRIIFTGGEPALQLDNELIKAVRKTCTYPQIAIETNGTINISKLKLDWITVSPKQNLIVNRADEIKMIYNQGNEIVVPEGHWSNWYIQPCMTGNADRRSSNTIHAVAYVKHNPPFKLSVQVHKLIGIK